MSTVLRPIASAAVAALAMAASLCLVEISSADDTQTRVEAPAIVLDQPDTRAPRIPVVAPDTIRDVRR